LDEKAVQERLSMSSSAVATVVKMLEALPEPEQARVADHLREYLADLRDERQWDKTYKKTRPQLIAAARRAKREIAKGQAKPLDLGQL
jgi:hypothetical protein